MVCLICEKCKTEDLKGWVSISILSFGDYNDRRAMICEKCISESIRITAKQDKLIVIEKGQI